MGLLAWLIELRHSNPEFAFQWRCRRQLSVSAEHIYWPVCMWVRTLKESLKRIDHRLLFCSQTIGTRRPSEFCCARYQRHHSTEMFGKPTAYQIHRLWWDKNEIRKQPDYKEQKITPFGTRVVWWTNSQSPGTFCVVSIYLKLDFKWSKPRFVDWVDNPKVAQYLFSSRDRTLEAFEFRSADSLQFSLCNN